MFKGPAAWNKLSGKHRRKIADPDLTLECGQKTPIKGWNKHRLSPL